MSTKNILALILIRLPTYTLQNAKYLKELKDSLPCDKCLICGDFTNYQFVIYDEIQGYHWSKESYTLHIILIYSKQDFLSADLSFETCFVHEVKQHTSPFIEKWPGITKIHFFSDG